MDELVQWLRAQLADDEAHAKKDLWAADKATPGRWRARYGTNLAHSWIETESTPVLRLDAAEHEADALLVARFQPETVRKRAEEKLREIDADRKLIADCAAAQETVDAAAHPDMYDVGRAQGLEEAVRRRASAYDQRSGYREEWRP